jgi:hypothetical protein
MEWAKLLGQMLARVATHLEETGEAARAQAVREARAQVTRVLRSRDG